MSQVPGALPEAIIASHSQLNLNESALDDASEDESVHAADPRRRFSRRQSRNADPEDFSSILTPKERRASRRGSHLSASGDGELRGRRPSSVSARGKRQSQDGGESLAPPGGEGERRGSAVSSHGLPTGIDALRAESFATRRPSRTSASIYEESHAGLSRVNLPELTGSDGGHVDDRVGVMGETIKEEEFTPAPTRAVSPMTVQESMSEDPRTTGIIASWRGATILVTACFAQFVDNIWVTSVNIALPSMSAELNLSDGTMSWLVSAYTLTFGGFLLLAGVLADRYGRRIVFSTGMAWMAIFTVAVGASKTDIQCIIFRALQGLGAAASVPSAIGALSNYFVGKERHRALSMFGAAGAVGFVVGLILSGLLTGTLGWRYLFYIFSPVIVALSISGFLSFPQETIEQGRKPALDIPGAAMGTSGMILLTFALSQSEVTGWAKPVIIVPLIVSVIALFVFAYVEKKVKNPIMPLYLWKLPSFAGIWCSAFLLYCWWASVNYYITLICQEVLFLTPLQTGVQLIPMGFVGFIVSLSMGRAVERYPLKPLLIWGYAISVVSTLPAAFVKPNGNFWAFIFPTSILGVTGVSIAYNVGSIALVSAVPPAAKSLAGGLINTAFQIGSGVGLAITSVVNENVREKYANPNNPASIMAGYQAALFTTTGLVGVGLLLTLLCIRGGQQATAGMVVH